MTDLWGIQKFRDLKVGSLFTFESEGRYLGMARGPWIKVSARRYRHEDDTAAETIHRIGSINAEVIRQG